MKFHLILLFCSWAAVFTATGAHAEKADRDKPMNIEADTLKHDDQQQLTTFTGKVQMTKGSLVLKAHRMEVKQDGQGNQVAKLWAEPGERIFFRQKREALEEFTEGEAETAVYNSQADTLTLTSRAELRLLRGTVVADRIQGQQILVNNTTEVFTVDGKPNTGSGNQRVKATITPRPKTSDVSATPTGPALKPSPRIGNDKP
ncbi:lipopolysaccharide transport periplasmic protein LptA [Limnohabitans sp. Hippo4]|uniref:lipopolysaccharide transport periplasmic protein LptA n=1 Tax=Limnohabitans sp. Hippo4 TaxID=1826167 RepID=UPI000D3BD9E2|nr:lipopolysaccharide transport periplasmic protein LptA [Limnohabitans sp. Hippo4]PUE35420.1 lipopolysaccharide transport periplasmic protein LptA [Limnohabitans sp. Hippo4]